jgi:guanylate kinase
MKKGKLVVVSGPSAGVGKDTILKMFLDKHPEWHMPPSTTTRPPRPGEVDGKDMQFVDRPTFEKWQKDSKFLESILVNDNQWYGTLREPVETLLAEGKNVILRKDVRGALLIKKAIPQTKLIFITAENWEALKRRIRARGTETEEGIKKRLELAKKELTYQDKYDHIIINPTGHPEKALKQLESVV